MSPERHPARLFVSYSHEDEVHKNRLLVHLEHMRSQGLIEPWDDRRIVPSTEWDATIKANLESADLILLLISADFMASRYIRKVELKRAIERHERGEARVIPVFVDHCDWKGAPFGRIQGVPEGTTPVADYDNPNKAWTEVATAIRAAIGDIETTAPARPATPNIAGTDQLRIYGQGFAGRTNELGFLDDALAGGRVRVLSLWAEGGAGKTRLLVRWLTAVRDDGWRGLGSLFVHSFYSQGSSDDRNASSDVFFEKALRHFGHRGAPIIDPTDKGRRLAALVAEQSGLLVLDGLEPLQYPPHDARAGEIKDPAVRALLLALANGSAGLALVTTRQELRERIGSAVAQQALDRLDGDAGTSLLQDFGVTGADDELRRAVEDYRGHAYSLTLLGTFLHDATPDHDIRRRHDFNLLDVTGAKGEHASHLFEAYEKHLGPDGPEVATLRLLGFFDRPASAGLIEALRRDEASDDALSGSTKPLHGLRETEWRSVLTRLTDLRLLDAADDGSLDSHPLLREHFAMVLQERLPDAFRAGHGRLYEHLTSTTAHHPDTLEDLQPLYQAVRHGCLANIQQQACDDVYFQRILRGAEFYSIRKLGAYGNDLGAVTSFFEEPWRRPSDNLSPADQAWVLSEAASRLRALGRLTDALKPMRAGLDMVIGREDWENAAISAGNLSELKLGLGRVDEAVNDGRQSVELADRCGDAFEQSTKRTTLADALHQAGRRKEARSLFEEAETMQAAAQPRYPRLHSLPGFQYGQLLLARAERAAWRRKLSPNISNRPSDDESNVENAQTECAEVTERAMQSLNVAQRSSWLLDIALARLTLARSGLYRTLLMDARLSENVRDALNEAVSSLRAAGHIDDLPRGLLTRSWAHAVSGDERSARADLDEAADIAERGSMKLYLADVHLHRARLFRDEDELEAAAALIAETGYHRRDGELADAREAAAAW